jgi:hypothetical protein
MDCGGREVEVDGEERKRDREREGVEARENERWRLIDR